MTVRFLTRMLTTSTDVTIKDADNGKILFEGYASDANFEDTVKDWDFSEEHIIYI